MSTPMIKRISVAAPAALNANTTATEDVTALTFIRVVTNNAILDMLNDPDPAAGLRYSVQIWKNGVDTGRRVFSNSMSAASAGRMAIGPIGLGPGDYMFVVQQHAGALTAQSWIIKFGKDPGK